jgi:hypothetical protein
VAQLNPTSAGLLEDLKALYLREIATLERELELYPNDLSLWQALPGMPNVGGTLFLHLAGSLQHFFGATLGGTGYVRDRAAEFSRRDVPRDELKTELGQARAGVLAGFATLEERHLEQMFPVQFADAPFPTRLTLLQFLAHLAYHLGQIDYHRRGVTGDSVSANAIAASDLLEQGNGRKTP